MENLSESNLFTSHFIMGCIWNRKTNLDCINSLSDWLDFKDTDYGMRRCRTDRTQSVSFLQEIDLGVLKLIIEDLITIYKRSYPYATKEDFIDHVFRYTLYDLELIITKGYTGLGFSSKSIYTYYHYYDFEFNEWIDCAIPKESTIEHFKQYYKQVVALLNEIPFENKVHSKLTIPEDENLRTKSLIENMIEEMDDNGWEYAFKTEKDYNIFTDLLTDFFGFNRYLLPVQTTILKKGCKTRLAATLGKIHSELSNSNTLKKDYNFFEVVRTLSHFKNLSPEQLYKDLSRFGKD